jgi:hypothetical protein
MTLSKDDARFWDVRTLDRRLQQKQLSHKDLEKHLKALPDVADKGQVISLEDEDDDLEDDDLEVDEDDEDDVGDDE